MQGRLDAWAGVFLIAVALLELAAILNAFFGNGWDPLDMKGGFSNGLSSAFLVVLFIACMVCGPFLILRGLHRMRGTSLR